MPDQPSPDTPAGFFKRAFAFFYDLLLMAAMYFIIGGVAVAINGGEKIPLLWSLLISTAIFPGCILAFYYWFWKRCGQTLGMQAWRLKLIADNPPVTFKLVSIRYIASILGLACAGIGFFWMIIDSQGRTWHDIASRSRIVQMPKK